MSFASAAPAHSDLGIRHVQQAQTQWCWVACVQMIAGTFGNNTVGCEVARRIVGAGRDCCNSLLGRGPTCNRSVSDAGIHAAYLQIGVEARALDGVINEHDLCNALASRFAVQLGYGFVGSSYGHVLLLGGFTTHGASAKFEVLDPAEPESGALQSFESLGVYSFGAARWSRTWLVPTGSAAGAH